LFAGIDLSGAAVKPDDDPTRILRKASFVTWEDADGPRDRAMITRTL